MADAGSAKSETILVLCHSFFHNAFRPQKPVDAEKFEVWRSSRFIVNLIIEKYAELPEGYYFAVTSLKAFNEFAEKFLSENPSYQNVELVQSLYYAIMVVKSETYNKLSTDEGVIAICDTLHSRSPYTPILVSNVKKKKRFAEDFYNKLEHQAKEVKIPFPIYTIGETEAHLRAKYPDLCEIIDLKTEKSGY